MTNKELTQLKLEVFAVNFFTGKFHHPADHAGFELQGIDAAKERNLLLFGDWSGGTNPEFSAADWVEDFDVRLLVRPILQITDEHAIEICIISACDNIKYSPVDFKIIRPEKGATSIAVLVDNNHFSEKVRIGANGTIWMPDRINARVPLLAYQKLQAWGYAMPFKEHSPIDLINFNIYKFKE